MLEQEAPAANGKTWAAVIAEALLKKARKGDVRAIAELANRVEGKARQTVDLELDVQSDLMERIVAGRRRVADRP
jgi:L-rhamnose isomerase